MNNRYKFRAWHREQKVMLYEENQGDCLRWLNEGQPIDVMQWTGLLDKNKKPIYEGDILGDPNEVFFDWIVEFRFGCFGIVNKSNPVRFTPVSSSAFFIDRIIIGNIHEGVK